MVSVVVFVLGVVGFACIALCMRRHRMLFPLFALYRTALSPLGWASLITSFGISASQPHASVAVVEWFGLMALAALPMVAIITFLMSRQNKNAR
ncbi:MAG: DUF3325 family protein [Rhodospirillaceae bacterium]|nr:DUF3325 family protein [Rhodospirillaceae bacterium]